MVSLPEWFNKEIDHLEGILFVDYLDAKEN